MAGELERFQEEAKRKAAAKQMQIIQRQRELALGGFEAEKAGKKPSAVQMRARKAAMANKSSPQAGSGAKYAAAGQAALEATKSGSGGSYASGLGGGAASGALAGSTFGAPGMAAGAAIGGTLGALKAHSSKKAAKREAQAVAQRNIGNIKQKAGQEQANALQNIMNAFRSSLIG